MSKFTIKYIDTFLDLCKYWMIGFGLGTYPLWMVKTATESDWFTFSLFALTPVMVMIFAFIVTFQRYKERQSGL